MEESSVPWMTVSEPVTISSPHAVRAVTCAVSLPLVKMLPSTCVISTSPWIGQS